ncbi:hypothetical protein, partial [Arthrobacter sp. Bi26]|uniref:hypothetical protein n=1 Tax=Arthrobacter sp. Bi26 TaxID=2822350 RepID=UPI001E3611EC
GDVFPGFGVSHSGRPGSGSSTFGSVAAALLAIASKSAEAFPRMSTAASDRASLAWTFPRSEHRLQQQKTCHTTA